MLRRTLIAAAAMTLFAARAEATVVRAMTLEEKCQIAPLIVYAAVERVESEWDEDSSRARIRTRITVRVIETLKGDAAVGSKLNIVQGGGQIGDIKVDAAGLSKWELGEEVVLFLEPLGPYLVELGIGIGKYNVASDQWVTHAPNVSGARITPGQRMKIEPVPPMEPMKLHKFLKLVRSHIAGIKADPPLLRKGAKQVKKERAQ